MFLIGLTAGLFAVAERMPFAASVPVLKKIIKNYRLGLDLAGGTHLLYRADFSAFRGGSRGEAMEGLRDVVERRVNIFGVTEPVVQVESSGDDYRLIVELAGVKDINEAIRLIGETPFLEFKEARPDEERTKILEGLSAGENSGLDPYFTSTELTGRFLKKATLEFDQTTNTPLVALEFNAEGEALFEAITERNVGKPLAIYLDAVPLSAPTVREKISGGKAQISGQFTIQEARDLVRRLNYGALPVPITLIGQQSVESSLGSESLAQSLMAAIFGFAAVSAFMVLWYRLPGLIAVLALVIYGAIVLSLFKIVPVTLTAAGVAGFVLSVGMAVDANVLIFERMKEETRLGKDLAEAMREGFHRAWTSIRDSNVSSLITAAILYWLGTSVVRGFALTLTLGILVSMFSAITVSRTFLLVLATSGLSRFKTLFLSGLLR